MDGGYSITLSADGPLFASNVAESKDLPPRVVVDFERVSPGAAPAITTVNNDGIDRVRVSTHSRNPLITRVVIDLTPQDSLHRRADRRGPTSVVETRR